MDDLIKFAKEQFAPARKIICDGRELTPMLIFDSGEGTSICAVPQYGEPDAKGLIREMLRKLMKEKGATRYAFAMEAWMGERKRGELPPGYLPSKDPERKEAIVVSAADINGRQVVLASFISRDGGISFAEPEVLRGAGGGPLLELLSTPTKH